MVIYAYLDTNVNKVVPDSVDEFHKIRYNGSLITLRDLGGRDHILDLSTRELRVYNIQSPELPIVKAIAGFGIFDGNRFYPRTVPPKSELYKSSTIFELERLAEGSVIINGIARLNQDGTSDFSPNDSYFIEQKAELGVFVAAYARAVDSSHFGKPILEGFYEAIKKNNLELIAELKDPALTEARRKIIPRMVYQEEDFANAFGRNRYNQLKTVLGEPTFS